MAKKKKNKKKKNNKKQYKPIESVVSETETTPTTNSSESIEGSIVETNEETKQEPLDETKQDSVVEEEIDIPVDESQNEEVATTDEAVSERINNDEQQDTVKDNPVDENKTEDLKPEENTDLEKPSEELKKKDNLIPIAMILIIAFVLVFLIVLLPLSKKNSALEKIENGQNEEAIAELSGIVPLFGINDLKQEAMNNIIYELAEELQRRNQKFSSDNFSIDSINDSTVDIFDDYEEANFVVNYSNKNASAVVNCHAEKTYDGSVWQTDKLDIVSAEYLVNKECDQSVPDETISKEYQDAEFVEKTEKEQLHQTFVYEYKSIDEENPFYYAINRLNVLCTYNMAENKWVVAEVKKSIVSTEEIPYKEFTTSIFKISLPEAWYLKMYESSWSHEYDGEHHESYSYSYNWFVSKEDSLKYSEKDGGPTLLTISISADNYNTPYQSNNPGKSINSTSFGKGKLYEYNYNDFYSYSLSFNPTIKGLTSSMYVSSGFTDPDALIDILNNAKLKNTTYNLEVLVKKLNIRQWGSTNSQVVGSASKGQKYTATEVQDNYDGYRWYRIDEEKWMADLDGEYLKVTYN